MEVWDVEKVGEFLIVVDVYYEFFLEEGLLKIVCFNLGNVFF